jgi:hypothetical protein
MNYPFGWFNIKHIAVVDERIQTDTYLVCSVLAEGQHHARQLCARLPDRESRGEQAVCQRGAAGYHDHGLFDSGFIRQGGGFLSQHRQGIR